MSRRWPIGSFAEELKRLAELRIALLDQYCAILYGLLRSLQEAASIAFERAIPGLQSTHTSPTLSHIFSSSKQKLIAMVINIMLYFLVFDQRARETNMSKITRGSCW